jgi:hypothetical protein
LDRVALTPISDRVPAQPAPGSAPANEARAAAQRAFFQAALAKVGAPAAPAPAAAAARTETRAVQPAVTPLKDEQVIPPHPGRILRPGSLVDIKV